MAPGRFSFHGHLSLLLNFSGRSFLWLLRCLLVCLVAPALLALARSPAPAANLSFSLSLSLFPQGFEWWLVVVVVVFVFGCFARAGALACGEAILAKKRK